MKLLLSAAAREVLSQMDQSSSEPPNKGNFFLHTFAGSRKRGYQLTACPQQTTRWQHLTILPVMSYWKGPVVEDFQIKKDFEEGFLAGQLHTSAADI